MKYQCNDCGAIYYSDEEMSLCKECGGKLVEVSPQVEKVYCPVKKEMTKTIRGIPVCEDFDLSNAVGFRCTRGEIPCECGGSSLPFYNPRVGAAG